MSYWLIDSLSLSAVTQFRCCTSPFVQVCMTWSLTRTEPNDRLNDIDCDILTLDTHQLMLSVLLGCFHFDECRSWLPQLVIAQLLVLLHVVKFSENTWKSENVGSFFVHCNTVCCYFSGETVNVVVVYSSVCTLRCFVIAVVVVWCCCSSDASHTAKRDSRLTDWSVHTVSASYWRIADRHTARH